MSFFNNLSTLFGIQDNGKSSKKQPIIRRQHKKQAKKSSKKGSGNDQRKSSVLLTKATQPTSSAVSQTKPNPTQSAQIEDLIREAKSKAREIIVEAKSEALSIRSQAENETREMSRKIEEQQRALDKKLDRIDNRLEQIDQKEKQLELARSKIQKTQIEIEQLKTQQLDQLEATSGLTKDEARKILLKELEKTLTKQMAQIVRQKQEEAIEQAEEKAQDILVDAMKHGATDYVAEYTVSVVQLPNEETKGKIIGKSGRNIHAFEKETGVDVDLDMSPTEVRISSFDPIRREIAKISLERLIKDGRIQPARIEEVVKKAKAEVDKITLEAGKKLCYEVSVYNLPTELMRMLGKFKYRFSYGQNLIAHTLEETKIGMKLASELGLDVNVVKLGCLLHDIGKVSEEAEGSHVELGIKIAKRFNLPQPVIDCIAQHHEDESFSGPEQMVVYIADAISGARPGARYENYDEYVKRLSDLEEIALSYPGVKQAYAIQAGREVRVLLDPEETKDDDVTVLSTKIRDEIKEKVTYPGTVTVTVIRETRKQEVAK